MDFEVMFIQALSVERATQMLKRNLHTDLAYTTTNADGNNEAHILSLISWVDTVVELFVVDSLFRDVAECSKSIDMITFSANSKTYTRKDVKEVDILHYRKAEFSILQVPEGARSFVPNGDAEIVLRYSHTDGEFGDDDIPQMTLCCTHRELRDNSSLGIKAYVLLIQWHTIQPFAMTQKKRMLHFWKSIAKGRIRLHVQATSKYTSWHRKVSWKTSPVITYNDINVQISCPRIPKSLRAHAHRAFHSVPEIPKPIRDICSPAVRTHSKSTTYIIQKADVETK